MRHEGFIKNISYRRNKYKQTSLSPWVDSVSIFADFNFFNYVDRRERAEKKLKVLPGSVREPRARTSGAGTQQFHDARAATGTTAAPEELKRQTVEICHEANTSSG